MHSLIIWIAIGITVLLQIVQAALGVVTQTFEAKSELHVTLLILASVAPILCSLWTVAYLGPHGDSGWVRTTLAFAVTGFTVCSIFLSLYRVARKFSFDVFWAWYNIKDLYPSLVAWNPRVPYFLGAALVIATFHYLGLMHVFARLRLPATSIDRRHGAILFRLRLLLVLVLLSGSCLYIDNEPRNVLLQIITPTPRATSIYVSHYENSIKQNKANILKRQVSDSDRNLFLIHLESLNAHLVNPEITPNLLRHAAQDGVLFREILAPSVLTIRSQETILCSVLPALKHNIAYQREVMEGLKCLPKLLQQRGFKTFYFHSYPTMNFANRDVFMRMIGFDELHAGDIMKKGDKLLNWGYPEDIYYERVFEYLEKFRGEKIFAYIGINTTNHFPFYDEEKEKEYPQFREVVPFRRPKGQREKIANTTFMQDQFFGDMYVKLFKKNYGLNSHMIAFGDHSWPIGIHANNLYSENHAYQENFATSLAIIPAGLDRGRYRVGTEVKRSYSYVGFLPTVAEMYGIDDLKFYGQSFLGDAILGAKRTPEQCTVAVQPFGGGHIAIINYPLKHIFKLADNSVATYDLSRDPNETVPLQKKTTDEAALKVLEACLQSLKR